MNTSTGSRAWVPNQAVTLEPGETKTLEFRGLSGDRFGVSRILLAGSLTGITVQAKINGVQDLFTDDVQAPALKTFFERRALAYPVVIAPNQTFKVTLANGSALAATVAVALVCYDAPGLDELAQQLAQHGDRLREPVILTARADVAAQANGRRRAVELRSFSLALRRWNVYSSNPNALRVTISARGERIRQDQLPEQINAEFDGFDLSPAIVLRQRDELVLFLSNTAAGENQMTFIAEGYEA